MRRKTAAENGKKIMKTIRRVFLIAIATMFLATQAKAVLFFARPYDPNLARWITRDPLGEQGSLVGLSIKFQPRFDKFGNNDNTPFESRAGANLYDYVNNNPINYVDPLGLLTADRYEEIVSGLPQGWGDLNFQYYAGPDGSVLSFQYEPGIQLADDEFSLLLPTKCNLFSKGRNVFPTRGLLNQRNPFLRIGWGWRGSSDGGGDVFRIAWGESGGHFNIWPPTAFW